MKSSFLRIFRVGLLALARGMGLVQRICSSITRVSLILFALIGMVACGGGVIGEQGPIHVGNIPQLFLNELGEGTLRAALEVYGPGGALEHTQELQINQATGEIFSTQFQLKTGFTYTFLIIFYYTAPGFPELPVAFVAKVVATEGDSLAVFWDESEIMTANAQLNPQVSASLSTSNIPDLDADDDGYDNFAEFREKSDPLDPNSIPVPPVLISEEILHTEDYVELELEFIDASGVGAVSPADPICGYYTWDIANLTEDGKQQKLRAKFNLHALDSVGSSLTLKIQVNDVLGLSRVYEIMVDGIVKNTLSLNDPLNQPQIAILTPQAGETVSDFVNIHALACDENGISALKVDGLGLITDTNSNASIFEGVLDTTNLGDGPQNITLLATSGGYQNTKSVKVTIANQNAIKIDLPQPGQVLKDGFAVAAHVDKSLMPNVANLFIESITDDTLNRNEIFALNQLKLDVNSLPDAFTGQVLDTFQVQNQIFIIKYIAVGTSGNRLEREVKYRINNYPEVEYFTVLGHRGPLACLEEGGVEIEWSVGNVNLGAGGKLTIDGQVSPTSTGISDDLPDFIECQGEIILHAERKTTDQSTGLPKILSIDEFLKLAVLEVIDSPEEQVSIPPSLFRMEFEAIENSNSISNPETDLIWELDFFNLTQGQMVPTTKIAKGLVIDSGDFSLGFIEPRTDYNLNLYLVNPLGDIISRKENILFTMGDDDLVGWWRFDNPSQWGKDSSGLSHIASVAGNVAVSSSCVEGTCGFFEDYEVVYLWVGSGGPVEFNLSRTSFTVEAWVNWETPEASLPANTVVISRAKQYQLETDSNRKLRFKVFDNGSPSLEYSVIYDGEICDPLLPGNWYHISATYNYDASPGNKPLRLYVNGEDCSDPATDTGPNEINLNGDGFLFLGKGGFGNEGSFDGFLDEVAIYRRALSPIEVLQNFERYVP